MSNQDYLATAFVQVKPRTVGFQAELREQLRRAVEPIKNTTVLVSPSTVGFASKLRTQVREAITASGVHTVPVTPVLTKFRAQLAKELNAKPIPVTVTPVGKAAATGLGGAAGAERELGAAEKARREITDALRESERLLKQSTQEGIPLKERDALVTRSQALARQALTRITEGQIAGERVLVQESLRARGLRAEEQAGRAAGDISDEKARLDEEAKAADAASVKQKLLADTKENLGKVSDRLVLSMDRVHKAIRSTADPAEKLSVVQRELGVIEKERIRLQEDLQGAQRRNQKEQVEVIRRGVQQAETFESLAKVERASLDTKAKAAALSDAETKIAGKLVTAQQVQISSLTTLKAVREQENALQRQSTALDKLEETAQKQNAAATLDFVTAKRTEIATRKQALADQGAFIRNQQKEVTTNKNIGRGLIATSLSFLGLRGATLAAGGAFLAGAAAAATFAKAVSSAAALEQELNVFQATAAATAAEMELVQERAKELGADITLPAVGASDAAQAMTQLAKAGLNVQDSLDGARGTLQLATAAEISNAEATELVASALNSFGLAGIEATRVADLLTGAANEAQGTITDMGIALQQSSAVARQAGLSLEDTVAFITLLAKNGIRGSDAGTSLRTSLLRLIAPTKDANEALNKLGVDLLDTAGNLRPEVFAELQTALNGLETTARNQTLRKIFGQDAIRAAVIFGREGTAGLNAVRDATQEAGLASKLAEARTKGFSGQVAALRNNAETLGLTLGKLTLGPLGGFVDTLSEGIRAANDLGGAIQDLNDRTKEAFTGAEEAEKGGGFFEGLKNVLGTTGGDQIRELRATIDILKSGNRENIFGNLGEVSAVKAVKNINKEIRNTVDNAQSLSRELKNVASPEEAVKALEDLSDRLIGNSEDAEVAREKIAQIQTLITALGRTPTIIELAVFFNERNIKTGLDRIKRDVERTTFNLTLQIADASAQAILAKSKITGENAADLFHQAFKGVLTPEAFKAIMDRYFSQIPSSIEEANQKFAESDNNLFPKPAEGLSGKQILGRIAGFDAAKVRAELSGSTAELIAVLRAEQAFLEQQLQRKLVQKQPGLKRQIESALLGVQSDLEAIADDRKQSADDAAKKIEDANKTAAERLVAAFTNEEQRALNKETIAAQTETLKDDLATDKALLQIYIRQKAAARKKIKDVEALAAFLKTVNQKIFDINLEIAQDRKALTQSIRQQARENREKAVEGLELDIELAVINENKRNEIRLRRKLIAALEDQIKHEKGNTLKIKELRNEIARQKQAIKEAAGEVNDRNNAFAQLSFQFLTTMQGFSANLMGNLLPSGAIGGTVAGKLAAGGGSLGGGTSTTGGGSRALPGAAGFGGGLGGALLREQLGLGTGGSRGSVAQSTQAGAVASDAGVIAGPTRGQASTEIELLRQILAVLRRQNAATKHPSSKQNQRSGSAVNDTQ